MRSRLAGVLVVAIVLSAAVTGVRAEITPEERVRLEQTRDHTLAELRRMLAEVPRDPIICATGLRWFNFTYAAPHTPRMVAALRQLFAETKNPRNRRLVLAALSQENRPELAAFWRKLLAQGSRPVDWLPTIAAGLVKAGTTEDVQSIAGRLGETHELDRAILYALEKRPLAEVRPPVIARFRDQKAPADIRLAALRVLLQMRPEREAVLTEALSDPSVPVRAEGVRRLGAQPGTELGPRLRELLGDPAAEVRRAAAEAMAPRAAETDLPLFVGLLNDSDEHVRAIAERGVLSSKQRPAGSGNPFGVDRTSDNSHLQQLLELSKVEGSPVNTSPAVLLGLGRWKEQDGEFQAAKRLYRSAIEADRARKVKPSTGWDAGSISLFQLARLEYFTGSRAEALKVADQLAAADPKLEAHMQDYPLPGETMGVKARELGERLRRDFTENPFIVKLEALPMTSSPHETLKVRARITNVSRTPQRLAFRQSEAKASIPAVEASLILGGRLWTNATPDYASETTTSMRTVQPGQSVELELTGQIPGGLAGRRRVDLILQTEIVDAAGESKALRLLGVTSVERN